jgi:hypothetical protein
VNLSKLLDHKHVPPAVLACLVLVSVAETSLEASPFCHLLLMHDIVTRS